VNSGSWANEAVTSGSGRYGAILTLAAGSSEPSTYTFTCPTFSGSARHEGLLFAVRDAASIDGAAWTRGAAGTSIDVPAQSGLTSGDSRVFAGMHLITASGNTATVSPDPPTDWTQTAFAAQVTDGSASSDWSYAWSRTAAGASDSGPSGTFSGATIADWKGWSLAANPEGAALPLSYWDGSAEVAIASVAVWTGSAETALVSSSIA
jgi:hypothetical protein